MTIINDEGEVTPVYSESYEAPSAIVAFVKYMNS